jgi:hypothetical protein
MTKMPVAIACALYLQRATTLVTSEPNDAQRLTFQTCSSAEARQRAGGMGGWEICLEVETRSHLDPFRCRPSHPGAVLLPIGERCPGISHVGQHTPP